MDRTARLLYFEETRSMILYWSESSDNIRDTAR